MKQEEKRIKGKRWVMMLVACIILSCAGSAALCANAEEYPLPEGTTTPGSTQSESSVGAAQEEELHAVTREEAIALAKTAIAQAHCFPEGRLDRAQVYAISYTTVEHPDDLRWHVIFTLYREGTLDEISWQYEASLDTWGNIIEDRDIMVPHVEKAAMLPGAKAIDSQQIYNRYAQEADFAPFWEWSYTLKAAYSQEISPIVQSREANPEQVSFSNIYDYGLPGEGEISYDDALACARESLASRYQLTEEMLSALSQHYDAFDITQPETRRWKFTFMDPADAHGVWYRVEIDARSGEAIRVEKGHWQEREWTDQSFDLLWLF